MLAFARVLPLVVVGAIALPAVARAASDCSCIDWPASRRMSEAQEVFLGRFRGRSTEGPSEVLRFTVIHSMKGAHEGDHTVRRPLEQDCERSFQKDELALVFVSEGHLPICGGNVDIDKLLPTFTSYLEGGSPVPSLEALRVALAGRVGAGSKVKVYTPAYAGKTLKVGGTQVQFLAKGADQLPVVNGTTAGSLSFVAIGRPGGLTSYVLVAPEHGKLSVIARLDRDPKWN